MVICYVRIWAAQIYPWTTVGGRGGKEVFAVVMVDGILVMPNVNRR